MAAFFFFFLDSPLMYKIFFEAFYFFGKIKRLETTLMVISSDWVKPITVLSF